jgi:FtsP/CotA-like multicopper oxidase with cupredoxin domain
LLLASPQAARATIPFEPGTSWTLIAKADTISTSDGDSMWMWGYALDLAPSRMWFPGPTFIVNQGQLITVRLQNQLPVPVSIVFPGQNVTATGGVQGLLTREVPAPPAGMVQTPGACNGVSTGCVIYTFTASQPGTYAYYSGTRSDLEVEMGMMGTIIVRPAGFNPAAPTAYGDPSTAYDREYLFLVTEADPLIHAEVAFRCGSPGSTGSCDLSGIDMTRRHPVDWFVNGRNFPDTMLDNFVSWLPTQPYNCTPMMHPGERVLIRWIAGGMDLHPYHTHGQNHVVIARDGRLLATPGSAAPNLGISDYTSTNVPGETMDAIWGPWTGAKLGWDVYGTADVNPHTCNGLDVPSASVDPVTQEWCLDHDKPIPVSLPSPSDLAFGVGTGGMWGGTPYLGVPGDVPPNNPGNQTQLNVFGGISFMWHSHAERELTTNNIFIGGMATMAIVVPPCPPGAPPGSCVAIP